MTINIEIELFHYFNFRYEYYWADGDKYKKPTAVPAPVYVTLLMDWVDNQINDEILFPPSPGSQF